MIKNKYEINQQIYHVEIQETYQKEQCEDCRGTTKWKVTTKRRETFQVNCSSCRDGWESTGIINRNIAKYFISSLTIGSIMITTHDQEEPVCYMALETGIGSGPVYNEKDCFLDFGEAKRYGEIKQIIKQEQLDKKALDKLHRKYEKEFSNPNGPIHLQIKELKTLLKRLESSVKRKEPSS